MSLNIKNNEAYNLARELASLTGKSMTAVVIEALRAQVDRLKRRQEQKRKVQELMAIGKRCAANLQESHSAVAHGDMLYDELGMPK